MTRYLCWIAENVVSLNYRHADVKVVFGRPKEEGGRWSIPQHTLHLQALIRIPQPSLNHVAWIVNGILFIFGNNNKSIVEQGQWLCCGLWCCQEGIQAIQIVRKVVSGMSSHSSGNYAVFIRGLHENYQDLNYFALCSVMLSYAEYVWKVMWKVTLSESQEVWFPNYLMMASK